MATVGQTFNQAFKRWFTEGMHYAVGNIKDRWLVGPRPKRLGIVIGNLRSRIYGRILSDGFLVGTNVIYGIAWEKGIKPRIIVPRKKKALAIPVASTWPKRGWSKSMRRSTGLVKLKAGGLSGGKLRHRQGNLAILRPKVVIPRQAPRKFLEPGLREAMPRVMSMGEVIFTDVLKGAFPSKTVRP